VAQRELVVYALENAASVVLLYIAHKLRRELRVFYGELCPTIGWLVRRFDFEEIREIPRETPIAVPLSLEESSELLLSLALELELLALVRGRALFPLASVPQEHLELYSAYRKLPVCPRKDFGGLVRSIFEELEETTPMARYQFLSSVERLREIAERRVRKSRTTKG